MRLHVRCAGKKSHTLEPGDRLRIGRSDDNDLVLKSGAVSRFHAELLWDTDEDRPSVVDLGSSNGVLLNGGAIDERAHLPRSCVLDVGGFELVCELKEGRKKPGSEKFNLADSSGELVVHSKGPPLIGAFEKTETLHALLRVVEEDRRTGTLLISTGEGRFTITVAKGRAMDASWHDLVGQEALDRIVRASRGTYELSPVLQPSEAFLDVSFAEYLDRGF